MEEMAWQVPRALQSCAAHAVVIPLVSVTELSIRCHLANVPAELLIARATAELLLRENENEDDNEEAPHACKPDSDDNNEESPYESTSSSENLIQMDAMDHVMLLVKVSYLLF